MYRPPAAKSVAQGRADRPGAFVQPTQNQQNIHFTLFSFVT
jgi:hypothetical protein